MIKTASRLLQLTGSVDAAMRLYAAELGIYNLYYGHRVPKGKKAKWNQLYDFMNRYYQSNP